MNIFRWFLCLWGKHEPGELLGRVGNWHGHRCIHCDRPLWYEQ